MTTPYYKLLQVLISNPYVITSNPSARMINVIINDNISVHSLNQY